MADAHAHGHGGHADDHDHGHAHGGHAHGPSEVAASLRAGARENQRRLLLVIAFGLVILVAEIIGGIVANSLVLLSDAVHMSTDLGAVAIAYFAIRIGTRPPTAAKTYGYQRAEILAAFVNAVVLWGLSLFFMYEAFTRLAEPPTVDGGIVAGVGGITLGANLIMVAMLRHGGQQNLNVRSAYLHIVSDTLGSAAAVATGLGILSFGWHWLDPVMTFFIGLLVLAWTWRLTKDTVHILLEGTPATVPQDRVRAAIAAVPGVLAVHDLHVWSLTTGVDNLSAHVLVSDPARGPEIVGAIRERLRADYDLTHVTIAVETDTTDCVSCN